MKFFYCDQFKLPLPPSHRFPMDKYRLIREQVERELLGPHDELLPPPAITVEQLLLAHDREYVRRAMDGELSEKEVKRLGFPWTPELVERSRRSCGATLEAGRVALRESIAANLAGGTHHAHHDAAEGYCVFNDTAVAAKVLKSERRINRAVILDCDVHQGNGTAAILNTNDSIFTMSIHGEKNFPLRKTNSDLDIGLPDGIGDDDYLARLTLAVEESIERSDPQIAFYLAGADPYRGDRLGRLNLSKEGLRRRDQIVIRACTERTIPLVIVMAGGYADSLADLVEIHVNTLREAIEQTRKQDRGDLA